MTFYIADYPAPEVIGPMCGPCEGKGITGEQFEMPVTEPDANGVGGRVLVVDVFCGGCGGCGSGDPEHRTCKPGIHTFDESEWGSDFEDDDYDAERCPSCYGRRWNPLQSFSETETDTETDVEEVYLRVPCGCMTDQMREIQRDD